MRSISSLLTHLLRQSGQSVPSVLPCSASLNHMVRGISSTFSLDLATFIQARTSSLGCQSYQWGASVGIVQVCTTADRFATRSGSTKPSLSLRINDFPLKWLRQIDASHYGAIRPLKATSCTAKLQTDVSSKSTDTGDGQRLQVLLIPEVTAAVPAYTMWPVRKSKQPAP